MSTKPHVPTFEEWKAYEQLIRKEIEDLKQKGKCAFGSKYLAYYCDTLDAYRITVIRYLARQGISYDDRFTYLAYNIVRASTPDYNDSPYLDFEGNAAVLVFLEERKKEIEELIRVRKNPQNRKP